MWGRTAWAAVWEGPGLREESSPAGRQYYTPGGAPSFQVTVNWNAAHCFLLLADSRVIWAAQRESERRTDCVVFVLPILGELSLCRDIIRVWFACAILKSNSALPIVYMSPPPHPPTHPSSFLYGAAQACSLESTKVKISNSCKYCICAVYGYIIFIFHSWILLQASIQRSVPWNN